MTAPPPAKPTIRSRARPKNRQRNQLLITFGVLAALAIGLAAVLLNGGPMRSPAERLDPTRETTAVEPPAAPVAPLAADDDQAATLSGPQLVDDNGRTLWASPTAGGPISLAYLPPGCELILHCRPAALLDQPAGEGALRALGPQGLAMLRGLMDAIGAKFRSIESLVVGLRVDANGALEATLVVTPTEPLEPGEEGPRLPAPYANMRAADHEGASYHVGAPWCGYAPVQEEGRRYVVAPRAALHDVIEAAGAAPPLRRELEQIAAQTDDQRHATLLAAPSFLFTDGRALFAGVTESLESPVFEFLPDSLRAGSVSLHWGEDFYLEARALATAEVTATRLASQLQGRIADWPANLQLAVLDLNPAPHGRRLVAQLPAMVRLLSEYARSGVEDDTAVLNAYLPLPAGENLLAASELALAQLSSGAVGASGTIATAAPRELSIEEKLRRPASVSFPRDTLEMAISYLADEIQAPVVILGRDLQLEGITKNQSFGMDAARQPAEDVLLQILLKANPDRSASGPADPRQKLVYVVKPDAADRPTVYITTRSAAQRRGDPLPEAFLPAGER